MNDDYIEPYHQLREMVQDKTKSVQDIAKATGYSPGYVSQIRKRHKDHQDSVKKQKAKARAEALAEENRIKALIQEAVMQERETCAAIVEEYINTFKGSIWPGSEILVEVVKNREEVA